MQKVKTAPKGKYNLSNELFMNNETFWNSRIKLKYMLH